MRVTLHRQFEKDYAKLDSNSRLKVDLAISKFKQNPFDPVLKNHPLHGIMKGKKAISASNNLRIIFEEHKNYTLVIFLQTGTHNQVYQ